MKQRMIIRLTKYYVNFLTKDEYVGFVYCESIVNNKVKLLYALDDTANINHPEDLDLSKALRWLITIPEFFVTASKEYELTYEEIKKDYKGNIV